MAIDDSKTVVLLHGWGADAATTFKDESGKVWTAQADAQIDTAQYKFPPSSMLFDGTGDYLTTPAHSDFDFGPGDWAIDCWVRRNGTKAYPGIFTTISTTLGLGFGLGNSDNKVRVVWANTVRILTAGTIADTTWTHLAVVRYGNTVKVYLAGTADANTYDCTGVFFNSPGAGAGVGRLSMTTDANYWIGHIAELRVSKGIARWTANFTPPAIPYMPTASYLKGRPRNRYDFSGVSLG